MSGHSKWSKVKNQKATTDVVKSKAFTKASHAITIAVKEGGGNTDPLMNFRLRLAIEKAKEVNMPKENIKRAIERAAGGNDNNIETVIYEGFGPAHLPVYAEGATDNKIRTSAAVKHIFERYGGALTSPGGVSFLFERVGVIYSTKDGWTYDRLLAAAIEAGIDEIIEHPDKFELLTQTSSLESAVGVLAKMGVVILSATPAMRPKQAVSVDKDASVKILEFISELETLEDIQHIYTAQTRI